MYPIREGYPSVTSIINYVYGVPNEIVKWSVKTAATAMYNAIKDARVTGIKITKTRLLEIGEYERIKLLKESGKKGGIVHDAIQSHFEGNTSSVPEEYKGYYDAFSEFNEENRCTPILQEKTVCSHTYKFAGRFDNYCLLWGRRCLIDYKTSNHLRSEYGLQLAAYAYCLSRLGYPVERTYILHLKSNGHYQLVRYEDSFDDFLITREAFERKSQIEKPVFVMASSHNAIEKELNVQATTTEKV